MLPNCGITANFTVATRKGIEMNRYEKPVVTQIAAYRERKQQSERAAHERYNAKSNDRALDSGLYQRLGKHTGRVVDTYTAEVPLTLGFNDHNDERIDLVFVSLGGVDVTEYLPPDVLSDIRRHIELVTEVV